MCYELVESETLFKPLSSVIGNNNKYAIKCSQVEWIEEENKVFAAEVRQLYIFELSVDDGQALEVWCGVLYTRIEQAST